MIKVRTTSHGFLGLPFRMVTPSKWIAVGRAALWGIVGALTVLATRWLRKVPKLHESARLEKLHESARLELELTDLEISAGPPPLPAARTQLRSLAPPDVHAFEPH
jgi:hypothetical protein